MQRLWVAVAAGAAAITIGTGSVNYVLVGRPLAAHSTHTADNSGTEGAVTAHLRWFVDPTTLVLDVRDSYDAVDSAKVLAGFARVAAALSVESHTYSRVILARHGKTIFYMPGSALRGIGDLLAKGDSDGVLALPVALARPDGWRVFGDGLASTVDAMTYERQDAATAGAMWVHGDHRFIARPRGSVQQAPTRDEIMQALRAMTPTDADLPSPAIDTVLVVGQTAAVVVAPPFQDFPNVVFFQRDTTTGRWARQLEGLELGVIDSTHGLLDLHTMGRAADMVVQGPAGAGYVPTDEDYAKLANIALHGQSAVSVVEYTGFVHTNEAGATPYLIDKREYRDYGAELVSRAYWRGYPQDNCTMFKGLRLVNAAFERTDDGLMLTALTERTRAGHQQWTVRFAGFDSTGRMLSKDIYAFNLGK